MNPSGWIKKIKKAKKKLEDTHRTYAEKAEKHFYNDKEDVELPLFHSMVQVQRSALYAKPPNPEIRGRNNDVVNPLSREIAKVLEKSIAYQIDQSDFHSDAKRAVLDYIVTDLGVARIRLDTKTTIQRDEMDQPIIGEDGEPMMTVASQKTFIDHWPWKRVIYDIGKDWEECDWVCYMHYMTPREIKKEFNHKVRDSQVDSMTDSEHQGKTVIYEVWDKEKRRVYDLIEGEKKPIRDRKDPLRLKGFFDCYKPMISNMRSDKYIPQSEFKQIARQLEIVNNLEDRIDALTKNIKDVGFYSKEVPELAQLVKAKDGQLIAIDDLPAILGTGGVANFDKVIAKLPIVNQAQVVSILEQQKKDAKEQIYEITGLSDIVRGATKATETATAQQIKGQWASIRLQDKQSTINSWLKGMLRMMAEVIAEHFTAEQIQLMTGQQITPEMQQTMQSDVLRCYAIDVETDSTIQADEAQDKADRMEMINTLVPLLQNLMPAIQQNVMPMDMAKTLLLTAVKGYKYARPLEDMINGLGDNMQQLQQLQQNLQQMQMQAQQMEQGYQQQLQQAQQQMTQMQQQLTEVNMREEQRKDIEVQGEAAKDHAEAEKKHAETFKIRQEAAIASQPVMAEYQGGL